MTDFTTKSLLEPLSNYPVTKGDLPGHDFHGNQWTSAGLASQARRLMASATIVGARSEPKRLTQGHSALSNNHAILAAKAMREGKPQLAEAHLAASQTHAIAANYYTHVDPEHPQAFYHSGPYTARAAEASAAVVALDSNGEKPEGNSPNQVLQAQQTTNALAQRYWGIPKW